MGLIGRPPAAAGHVRLLDFVTVIGKYVPEPRPALLGHRDGSTKIGLHLGDAHVDAAVVLSDVEVEVLVVDVHVPALGQVRFVGVLVGAELVQEVGQCVPEFYHSLSRDGDLRTGAAARYRLRHPQESAPRVLLEI